MTATILRKIPIDIEDLVNSGNARVYGGIIKDIKTGRILAHVEQINNMGLNSIMNISPFNSITGVTGIVQNQKIIGQLTNVTNIMNSINSLAWINTALLGVNMGICVIGFAVVNRKLDNISKQLKNIDKKVNMVMIAQNAQITNEVSKLVETACNFANKAEFKLNELNTKGLTEFLSLSIGQDLLEIKSFLARTIDMYSSNQLISLGIEIIVPVYITYLNLLKSYIRARRLNNEDIIQLNHAYDISDFLEKMTSKEVLKNMYHGYVLSEEKLITEEEIDSILNIYKFTCEETYRIYDSQYQLLNTIPIDELLDMDRILRNEFISEGVFREDFDEDFVLVVH